MQERVVQLEQENNQLKDQLGTSKPMKSELEEFKKCALDQAYELHKARQNIYICIQKLQDFYVTCQGFNNKAQNALIQLAGLKEMVNDMTNRKIWYQSVSARLSHITDY